MNKQSWLRIINPNTITTLFQRFISFTHTRSREYTDDTCDEHHSTLYTPNLATYATYLPIRQRPRAYTGIDVRHGSYIVIEVYRNNHSEARGLLLPQDSW